MNKLAKAYRDGSIVATDELQTTGAPARVELTTDRTTLHADGQDAVVVAVSILDDKGRLIPTLIGVSTFQITGGGRILGSRATATRPTTTQRRPVSETLFTAAAL